MPRPDDHPPHEPVVIVTAGLLGSASTWAFNATVELLRGSTGGQVSAFFTDEINQRDEAELRPASATVIKTHAPQPSLRTLIRLAHLPVILTVREPCDAVVSITQRFGLAFDEAVRRISRSTQSLIHLADTAAPLILRYEDRFFAEGTGIRAIASHLGLPPSPALASEIGQRLSPDAIRGVLALAGDQSMAGSDWHRRHQWHQNYLGDGEVGKYRRLLTREQTVEIQHATRAFRHRFGYSRPTRGQGGGSELSFDGPRTLSAT